MLGDFEYKNMEQINTGGTNYQVETGEKNTNFFGGEHHHHYPQPQPNIEPKHFTVPYARNPYFTGRTEVLAQIHESLGQTGAAALSQAKAIHGLGGVGKTQTAVEYAFRYFYDQLAYEWVLWVNASNLTLKASFGSIASDLALPNHATNKLDENTAAVLRWLETNERWLLIFDNVDDPQAIKPFRPKNAKGRILLTSRAQRFESLGVANPIALNEMTRLEAITFLFHRTNQFPSCLLADRKESPEWRTVDELAKELGYLPLALEQAAAYILAKGVSFAAYLRSYLKRRLQLLEKEKPQTGDYPDSVATTWTINFEAVKQSNLAAAADLLTLSAFLAPDNIPYELLILGRDQLGDLLSQALADAAEDELVLPKLLEELTRYSLIRRETDNRYSIHRMVQEVLRDGLDEPTRQQWQARTVEALNQAFPDPKFENWVWCERLVEHVQAVEREQVPQTLALARLLDQTSRYLHEQGQYSEAELLLQQALQLRRTQQGEQHLDVAVSFHNLADLYRAQGRYKEAELLLQQALQLLKILLGEQHPYVATNLHVLALLYKEQGRYAEAELLQQQALQLRRTLLGEQHSDVAFSLNNLAELYYAQGRYEEAEPLLQQALQLRRTLLGEQHPDVLTSLQNLALLYKEQGRYAEAEPLLQQALQLRRTLLGEQHPHVAISLNNLAALYESQGRYEEAEPLYLQALEIRHTQLGVNHPDTATSLKNLAWLYRSQGRYSEAEPFMLQALHIARQQLGQDHPRTASSLNNLAELYRLQGRYSEAEPLYLQALNIHQLQLGQDHPDTATSLNNLALLYSSQRRYGEAEPLYLQALHIAQQQLGSDHPFTATSLNNLADLHRSQGRYREAEPLYLQALTILFNQLGKTHPTTQTVWRNFVYLLQQAIEAGQTAELSDHPLTQEMLKQLDRHSTTNEPA
jgi:tetratricopeptide (TPR) repeat protein